MIDVKDIENKIINSDCMDILKQLPDKCVDLVITSPPYDNLRTYNNSSTWSFDIFKGIAQELARVLADGGVIVWVVADGTENGSETGTSFRQALYFKELGLNIHDTMIWEKDTFSFPHDNIYRSCFEYMFVFSKGKPKTANLICDRKNKYAGTQIHGTSRGQDGKTFRKSNDKNGDVKEYGARFNVWHISCEKNNETGHPAVFPIKIANDHIISWSNENDLVLDCFSGSGTTAIACHKLKRRFICIEKDKGYWESSVKRLEDEQRQGVLF